MSKNALSYKIGGDESMDQVIMPELITPKLAEIIAKNPEILKGITGSQPGEKVITERNCTLECGSNPANIKLILCNVTIGMDEPADESIDGCHIKIGAKGHNQGCNSQEDLLDAQKQAKIEIAVLEGKKKELERILKLIPRQILNRKLVARCKKEILGIEEKLSAKSMGPCGNK
jgi:hypothetical protein